MNCLVDTNVISELRKGPRCNPGVSRWFEAVPSHDIYLSALTIGELRRGIENIRARDPRSATALERWLRRVVADHTDRILPVDQQVAEEWGHLNARDPLPVIDSLLAATAKVRGLRVVTRNTADVERTGVACLNPFDD